MSCFLPAAADFSIARFCVSAVRCLLVVAVGVLGGVEAGAKEYVPVDALEKNLLEFVNYEVEIEGRTWKDASRFPSLVWQSPDRVLSIIGQCPLVVRWFDKNTDEVMKPNGKGPYVAYLEGRSEHGLHIRRLVTASPGGQALTKFPHPATAGSFDEKQWLLDEQQIAVKRKVLGVEHRFAEFKAPEKTAERAPELFPGPAEAAGFKPEAVGAMRAACRAWYESSKEPFVVLVARHGTIVFHEAFDDPAQGTTTVETPKHMASLTKTMCAAVFAEFMDQGLVGLDDPVGKLLPDFPTTGSKAFTWRATFMHMAGLHMKAGDGREVHNAWSDNWAVDLLPCLQVGVQHRYNNMDTELTGKAMELITGESVLRLIRDNLFVPLGMTQSRIADVCHGSECTALDVGKFGQMLLNQGAYGQTRFFSKETFQKMLPVQIHAYWPEAKFDIPWGMGLTYFYERDPRAGKDGVPANKTLLSRKTFCHGAASGAVLRVDPENEVVVSLVREKNAEGDAYKVNLAQFLLAVDEGLVGRKP
jgi:CubicO group peptidase (beta-lactamase class C family)